MDQLLAQGVNALRWTKERRSGMSLSHQELVHRHRCIDGHLTACQGIKIDLLHAVRRLIREELRQTLNPHARR